MESPGKAESRSPRNDPVHDPEPIDPAAYGYDLPKNRIASRPARPRDLARLLVVRRDRSEIEDRVVRDLPDLLAPGDLVVVNETRVIPARLIGTLTGSDREIEILLVRESAPGRWRAWARPARAFRPGCSIRFEGLETTAEVISREGETVDLAFRGDVAALLAARGHVPLPPYVRRRDDEADRNDYQTIFARTDGAVAAPTAGLHFTPDLVARLEERGIPIARLLLHVGPGTFRPVRVGDIRKHQVESEFGSISRETARAIGDARRRGGRVVAVGTTAVRVLESAAHRPDEGSEGWEGWTGLTIVPPFAFRRVDALMTNFHLPRSSLLLLVCAFGGRERILSAYGEAVRRGYRFYSYGDAMLIL